MKKIRQDKEKQERNKLYAKKFEKSYDELQEIRKHERRFKNQGGKFGSWCRLQGHPPTCACVYSTDVVAGRR